MDQKPKLMTPFDMLVTSSSLYTLKLMLPFTPASMQRSLAEIHDGTFLRVP